MRYGLWTWGLCVVTGCGGPSVAPCGEGTAAGPSGDCQAPSDGDSDADTDADSDTDADTDSDVDTGTGLEACDVTVDIDDGDDGIVDSRYSYHVDTAGRATVHETDADLDGVADATPTAGPATER